jgi:hypothetical protein
MRRSGRVYVNQNPTSTCDSFITDQWGLDEGFIERIHDDVDSQGVFELYGPFECFGVIHEALALHDVLGEEHADFDRRIGAKEVEC